MSELEIIVSLSLEGETFPVGKLYFHHRHGIARSSFEYDKNWLLHPEKFALDPVLNLNRGTFHTKAGVSLFGAMDDSSPDRWGRLLMQRAHLANSGKFRTLSAVDYLLGVLELLPNGLRKLLLR